MLARAIDGGYRLTALLFLWMNRLAVISLALLSVFLVIILFYLDKTAVAIALYESWFGRILDLIGVTLLGMVPIGLPYVVLAYFAMGLIAGRPFAVSDLRLGLAGFGLCAVVVMVGFYQSGCDGVKGIACSGQAALFVLDQTSKGLLADVFDVFDLKIAPFDISVMDPLIKVQLLAFRIYSQAILFLALAELAQAWQARQAMERAPPPGGVAVGDRLSPAMGWIRDMYRGLAYACAVAVLLLAITIPLEDAGMRVMGAVPGFDAFLFILSALVALLMPYVALAYFLALIITGQSASRMDAFLGVAGLIICALAVATILQARNCSDPAMTVEALAACANMANGFTLDQFSKGALGDVLDIFGAKFAPEWSLDALSADEKLTVLSLRMFSELTVLAAAGACIAWLRRAAGLSQPGGAA
ncbi:MAG: hypothetical protein MUC58_12195 [Rhizobiaceae bacterium]|nr:hypothetical protein [Rhizobiaceae bacterium]